MVLRNPSVQRPATALKLEELPAAYAKVKGTCR